MYSYKDRIRAVRLYIKLGRRVAATIRQLGYPTENSLKSWHREFELRLDLPAGYARSKLKYSQEQKQLAVDYYLEHGRCISAPLRALGYPGRAYLTPGTRTDARRVHACCGSIRRSIPGTQAGSFLRAVVIGCS